MIHKIKNHLSKPNSWVKFDDDDGKTSIYYGIGPRGTGELCDHELMHDIVDKLRSEKIYKITTHESSGETFFKIVLKSNK